ncbi:MAG: hypothetical protein KC486_02090 [Myxococcales bacterium]|nr:hypothetical protein [Myxococcales bacterium]
MEIKKRNRAELKSYFVKNAIPTENNFADLIDATIVQASDGVAKPAGEPLSVEAVGDDTSRKQVLNFYNAFTDNGPAFSLELNPRSNPNDANSGNAGLSISDAAGASRLFIDSENGNFGIGTNEPTHSFHVKTGDSVGLFESTGGQAYLRIATKEGLGNRVEVANRSGGRLALWVAGGSDAVNVLRDGRVGIGLTDPQRQLHVGGGGELSLQQGSSVVTDSRAGVYWHSGTDYAIRREGGDWSAPNYRQLVLDWPTGIRLRVGTGDNAGYGKSYLDITHGKGVRITEGTLVVGGSDPGGSKFRIDNGGGDRIDVTYSSSGCGELRLGGWPGGWNIETLVNGKHLYLNRDSGGNSHVFVGRNGEETLFHADGRVAIGGGVSSAKLTVHGDTQVNGQVTAPGGVHFGTGNLGAHIDGDGVLYRFGGQAYLVVDDNFYIRDSGGSVKFHFDTDSGYLRQDGWTNAALVQSWVNYGGGYHDAGYYRDRQGRVHLRGLVRSGQAGPGKTIFVLPDGYRPQGRELRAVCTNSNTIGRVDVHTDGRVEPHAVNNGWVSLDGISFRTY